MSLTQAQYVSYNIQTIMCKNIIFLLFVIIPLGSVAQNSKFHYRCYDSIYAIISEPMDTIMLQTQINKQLAYLKKQFKKTNRDLGCDSISRFLDDTYYYYVPCFEIIQEIQDTVILRPYKKQLVKFIKLFQNDLQIGIFGDLGNLTMKTKYGGSLRIETIDMPGLKYSYNDVACSQFKLDFYKRFFAQNIFAIKDYVEDNDNYDFFWFSINDEGKLLKYPNKEFW